MPAEWEPHSGTLMTWPSNTDTWPGERLQKVELVYLNILKELSQFEPVLLLVENERVRVLVENYFEKNKISMQNIFIKKFPVNDVWVRDCGPIFIKEDGDAKISNWEYNAWGGKYPPWNSDNQIPKFIADLFGIHQYKHEMVLEGGSIEVNGKGDLITTESVLLNPNRNPDLSKPDIENMLKDYFGAENIIWLKTGLAGDDTDGHVDDLTRFLNEDTVLTMICEDESDINYQILKENLEILESARLANGKALKIETLPLPLTKIEDSTVDGSEFVPASYANFYVANGCVLIPIYDDKNDEKALNLFRTYFPNRKIIGINCTDLVWGQGSIHCITQQLLGVNFQLLDSSI